MRKAFDANIPKLRPRLKSSILAEVGSPDTASDEIPGSAPDEAVPSGMVAPAPVESEWAAAVAGVDAGATPEPRATAEESPGPSAAARAELAGETASLGESPRETGQTVEARVSAVAADHAAQGSASFPESPDVQSRRERLLEIKRRVAAASRAAPPMLALPETPARAGESALALVRDLEAQLQRAREQESALRADLDQARTELARGAAEARRGAERLGLVEAQVESKRAVLEEMLAEMNALEEERDGAIGRAQALTALDEERQALLDSLSARADEAEKKRIEAEAEVARLGAELQERAADAVRTRAALAQVTRERDDLARDLAEARRERDELAEARKALEQVHEALATARTRLG